MEYAITSNTKPRNTPFLLLIVSIVFSYYYVDIGFAFKPYMILSIFFFMLSLKHFAIHKLMSYEVAMLVFFTYYCLTGFFAKYPEYSIRLIFGIVLIMFCYFVMRYILSLASIDGIEKGISYAGLLYNGLSLLFYLAGLVSLNFVMQGNQIREYGVMMDRGSPRLIGIMEDPNAFCFYNLIFFFYFLTHLNKKWSKLGLLLSATTILLSFSRGGIAAVLLGLFIMFLFSNVRRKFRMMIIIPLSSFVIHLILKTTLQLDVIGMIVNRFTSVDGGSGRTDLWSNGIQFFSDSPVFGIGLFNYRAYTEAYYGYPLYMHNAFMDALVEGGVVGLALYILIFVTAAVTYLNNRTSINDKGYLFFALAAMVVMMNTYSLMVNEAFFILLAVMWRYLLEVKHPDRFKEYQQKELNSIKTKKKRKRYRLTW